LPTMLADGLMNWIVQSGTVHGPKRRIQPIIAHSAEILFKVNYVTRYQCCCNRASSIGSQPALSRAKYSKRPRHRSPCFRFCTSLGLVLNFGTAPVWQEFPRREIQQNRLRVVISLQARPTLLPFEECGTPNLAGRKFELISRVSERPLGAL